MHWQSRCLRILKLWQSLKRMPVVRWTMKLTSAEPFCLICLLRDEWNYLIKLFLQFKLYFCGTKSVGGTHNQLNHKVKSAWLLQWRNQGAVWETVFRRCYFCRSPSYEGYYESVQLLTIIFASFLCFFYNKYTLWRWQLLLKCWNYGTTCEEIGTPWWYSQGSDLYNRNKHIKFIEIWDVVYLFIYK